MSRKKLKIALIFGGTSEERKVSLMSAQTITKFLNKSKYQIIPVEISKAGKIPFLKLSGVDFAFLALHGPGGEDGTVQGLLEILGIKYTGSKVLASALAMDKAKTKRLLAGEGILVAPHIIISKKDYLKDPKKYLSKLRGKIVIKPNQIGSSIGITISSDKKAIKQGIENAFKHDNELIVEPFLKGREFTVPILGNSNPHPLPAIEIVPKISEFFDYAAKYQTGGSDEIVPAPISKGLTNQLQGIAMTAHKLLGCRGITRSDFIVTDKGEIYFLEINTIPGMTENSLAPKAAKAARMSYSQFLDKLISLGLDKER